MRWLTIALFALVAACHGSSDPKAGTAHLDDVRAGLRQLGKDIGEVTASIADARTNEDPSTFRGRLEAENQRLHERFEGLRERTRKALETDREKANREKIEELQKELDETKKDLDEMDAKMKAAAPPA
jgi:predicted RNase H-like nuclease (RuvC/YqgF family)